MKPEASICDMPHITLFSLTANDSIFPLLQWLRSRAVQHAWLGGWVVVAHQRDLSIGPVANKLRPWMI